MALRPAPLPLSLEAGADQRVGCASPTSLVAVAATPKTWASGRVLSYGPHGSPKIAMAATGAQLVPPQPSFGLPSSPAKRYGAQPPGTFLRADAPSFTPVLTSAPGYTPLATGASRRLLPPSAILSTTATSPRAAGAALGTAPVPLLPVTPKAYPPGLGFTPQAKKTVTTFPASLGRTLSGAVPASPSAASGAPLLRTTSAALGEASSVVLASPTAASAVLGSPQATVGSRPKLLTKRSSKLLEDEGVLDRDLFLLMRQSPALASTSAPGETSPEEVGYALPEPGWIRTQRIEVPQTASSGPVPAHGVVIEDGVVPSKAHGKVTSTTRIAPVGAAPGLSSPAPGQQQQQRQQYWQQGHYSQGQQWNGHQRWHGHHHHHQNQWQPQGYQYSAQQHGGGKAKGHGKGY
eukprot:TRINITY_DN72236_c0_g1_i1.p1 TRINITY_DN72236_c0_g1~~TRINITY_DN72236_c0_g1_i1.p1  ORF type:complete len:406 (+),score=58.25 TRINITY_DN72236_c0_g1_i1:74-1291(+)